MQWWFESTTCPLNTVLFIKIAYRYVNNERHEVDSQLLHNIAARTGIIAGFFVFYMERLAEYNLLTGWFFVVIFFVFPDG